MTRSAGPEPTSLLRDLGGSLPGSKSPHSATGSETARLAFATAGDHAAILAFLQSVFHAPSAAEFQFQLEHPQYEPTDRLIVRVGTRVVAHLRLSHRSLRFLDQWIPVTYLEDLATATSARGMGYASNLLQLAEQAARRAGSWALVLRARKGEFLHKRGWSIIGEPGYSLAPPREILASLSERQAERESLMDDLLSDGAARQRPQVRLWRHMELDTLQRLYASWSPGTVGAAERTEAHWQWLISRRGYDRIYTAVRPDARLAANDLSGNQPSPVDPIVGYAAMRDGRIVELVCESELAQEALLARACGDAIERDHHCVRVDAPPGDPVHRLIRQAGGQEPWRDGTTSLTFMAKLIAHLPLLDRLRGLLWRRIRQAGLNRPAELGLQIGDQRLRMVAGSRSVKWERGRLGRSYLTATPEQFAQLVFGYRPAGELLAHTGLTASTRVAAELAEVLFPRQYVWLPPWDDLPTR